MPFQSLAISALGRSSWDGSQRNADKLFIALSLVVLSCYNTLKSAERAAKHMQCVPVEARYFPSGGTSADVEAAMVVVVSDGSAKLNFAKRRQTPKGRRSRFACRFRLTLQCAYLQSTSCIPRVQLSFQGEYLNGQELMDRARIKWGFILICRLGFRRSEYLLNFESTSRHTVVSHGIIDRFAKVARMKMDPAWYL